jgi:hypothetical protein
MHIVIVTEEQIYCHAHDDFNKTYTHAQAADLFPCDIAARWDYEARETDELSFKVRIYVCMYVYLACM